MAATVIYDHNGAGGQLFAGTKFCFLQRVPDRKRFIGLVQANGGEVVNLEKWADIVIADHARKNCPPGSISWKYIEDSVNRGMLQDPNDFRAGPAELVVRAVGSSNPSRRHRVPFTDEDDRELMKWVMKAERSGIAVKGNIIYEQLEEVNPRHTSQSWRDRWVKYVSHYKRPDLEDTEGSLSPVKQAPRRTRIAVEVPQLTSPTPVIKPPLAEQETPSNVANSSRPVRRLQSQESPMSLAVEGDRALQHLSSPTPSTESPMLSKSAKEYCFSAADLELLHQEYDSIINVAEDKAIDAWLTWARSYPHHSAQEWRNCFIETVIPEKKAMKQDTEPVDTPKSAFNECVFIAPPSSPPTFLSPSKPPSLDGDLVLNSYSIPGHKLSKVDSYLTDEKLFQKDLAVLAASLDPPLLVDFRPKICGKPTSLFRLWQVVRSDEFGGYIEVNERDLWSRVARSMNFNDFQHSRAHSELKACYEEILADFEEYLLSQDGPEDMTESQENDLIDQQLGLVVRRNEEEDEGDEKHDMGTKNGQELAEAPHLEIREESLGNAETETGQDEDDDNLEAPSSMPRPSTRKRKLSQEAADESQGRRKQHQIGDRKETGQEIPSTPDDVLNLPQRLRISYQPSPLKYNAQLLEDLEDEAYEPFSGPVSKPDFGGSSPSRKVVKKANEPETQDFFFPPRHEEDEPHSPTLPASERQRRVSARRSNTDPKVSSRLSAASRSSSIPPMTSDPYDLQAFFDRFISLGYSHEIVGEALTATCMQAGNAPLVMESLTTGLGIPDDLRGVWTAEDDKVLEKGQAAGEEWFEILKKHGRRGCQTRIGFLKDLREAGD